MTGPLVSGRADLTVVRGSVNGRTGVWSETSRHTVEGCLVAPGSSVEQSGAQGAGDAMTADLAVYAPFDADVTATDRVLVGDGSQVFDVSGRPEAWQSPFTGTRRGMVVRLTVHTG